MLFVNQYVCSYLCVRVRDGAAWGCACERLCMCMSACVNVCLQEGLCDIAF